MDEFVSKELKFNIVDKNSFQGLLFSITVQSKDHTKRALFDKFVAPLLKKRETSVFKYL